MLLGNSLSLREKPGQDPWQDTVCRLTPQAQVPLAVLDRPGSNHLGRHGAAHSVPGPTTSAINHDNLLQTCPQSDLDNSTVEAPSFQTTPDCVKLKIKANT